MNRTTLPVAVIGAGPVGLAAAAHLVSKGEIPIVFEAGVALGLGLEDFDRFRTEQAHGMDPGGGSCSFDGSERRSR